MLKQRQILGSVGSLGIILAIASGVRANQTSTHPANSTAEFRQIEQPLSLKIGVTAGGLTLIGLELWWFLFSKNQAKPQYGSVKPGDPLASPLKSRVD
ncbi:MAG: hypothetical protein ABI262_01040 [Microcoleus sp.]|jgi:plastocyanin domain-containing protein